MFGWARALVLVQMCFSRRGLSPSGKGGCCQALRPGQGTQQPCPGAPHPMTDSAAERGGVAWAPPGCPPVSWVSIHLRAAWSLPCHHCAPHGATCPMRPPCPTMPPAPRGVPCPMRPPAPWGPPAPRAAPCPTVPPAPLEAAAASLHPENQEGTRHPRRDDGGGFPAPEQLGGVDLPWGCAGLTSAPPPASSLTNVESL